MTCMVYIPVYIHITVDKRNKLYNKQISTTADHWHPPTHRQLSGRTLRIAPAERVAAELT